MPANLAHRRDHLETLLLESQPLWQPATFRERRPAWCTDHPELTHDLLTLDDATLRSLSENSENSITWLSSYLPQIEPLKKLIQLPKATTSPENSNPKIHGVGARKAAQINAFIAAMGRPQTPTVEWCSGKGHLSRALLRTHGGEALAVERNPTLCHSGKLLSKDLAHQFLQADVMAPKIAETLRSSHAIALHACGDLHQRLALAATEVHAPAIHFAPCCYQLTAHEHYLPRSKKSPLTLNKNTLKLAVTETSSSAPGRTARSERSSAWKLAFINLREQLHPEAPYQTFPPIPGHWQQLSFQEFLTTLATREGIPIPKSFDFPKSENAGWIRHQESRRLQLVRLSYRRAIELWLMHDLAAWLEQQNYHVSITEFCPRTLTPRNLLVSARLKK